MKASFLVLMALCVLFNSGAHILMKYNTRLHGWMTRNLNPFGDTPQISFLFICGALFFAVSIIFYQAVLRRAHLSIAFSLLTALNYVIIILYSLLVFKDRLRMSQNIGLLLIFIGVFLVLWNWDGEKVSSVSATASTIESGDIP